VHNPVALVLASGRTAEAFQRSRLLEGLGRRERTMIERAAAARLAHRQQRGRLDALVADLEADETRLATLRAELDQAFKGARRQEIELVSRRDRQRRVHAADRTASMPARSPNPTTSGTPGGPRSGGRQHRGVDMFAPMAAEVYAITSGVIARHCNSRLGGLGLYLQGDDGNQYDYAHLKGDRRRLPAGHPRRGRGADRAQRRDRQRERLGATRPRRSGPAGARTSTPYPYVAAACGAPA
jgi:murein DD-endopeptidase MepM/ murein hydrolase activator NlpD